MGYSLLNNASLSVISRRLNARGLRAACFLLAAASLTAADWPGFRGPNATGVFDTPGLPVEFGPEEWFQFAVMLAPFLVLVTFILILVFKWDSHAGNED